MHGRAFTARGLDGSKQVVTAVGRGFRVDDDPARLIAEVLAVERVARFGLSGDFGEEHAALELAEVLHARDHLLAGVAALVEADSAEKLEVRHLRNELVLRRSSHQGHAAANVEPSPRMRAHGNENIRKASPKRDRARGRQDQEISAVLQLDDRADIRLTRCLVRLRRETGEHIAQRLTGPGPRCACDHDRVRGIRDLHFRAQHELRNVLLDGTGDVPRQSNMEAGLFAPEQEIRKHPAFRGAIGAVRARSQIDGRHIAAELSLQEGFRVLAAELEDSQVPEEGKDVPRSIRGETGVRSSRRLHMVKGQAHVCSIRYLQLLYERSQAILPYLPYWI